MATGGEWRYEEENRNRARAGLDTGHEAGQEVTLFIRRVARSESTRSHSLVIADAIVDFARRDRGKLSSFDPDPDLE